jgi:hypothetical protein
VFISNHAKHFLYLHKANKSYANYLKPILIRYGGAAKSSFKMNEAELNQAALSIMRRAREKAFYKGLPVYYADKGEMIAEYPNGRVEVVKIF